MISLKDEIKEILDYLKNDDYSPVFADEGCDDTPYKLFDETEVKLLKDYNINPLDVWRGFDLDKSNYGPFHMLSRVIFEKYINELAKFVPIPQATNPDAEIPVDVSLEFWVDVGPFTGPIDRRSRASLGSLPNNEIALNYLHLFSSSLTTEGKQALIQIATPSTKK